MLVPGRGSRAVGGGAASVDLARVGSDGTGGTAAASAVVDAGSATCVGSGVACCGAKTGSPPASGGSGSALEPAPTEVPCRASLSVRREVEPLLRLEEPSRKRAGRSCGQLSNLLVGPTSMMREREREYDR